MTNPLNVAVGVADLAALVALNSSSSPPRVDGGIYWVSDAGGTSQGRWAEYKTASTATVVEGAILLPTDSVGRWHLALAASGDGSGGGTDADADAYIARLAGSYSTPELAAIDALVVALKGRTLDAGGSQWDSLQGLWLRSLDTVEDSRLNLRSTSYSITDVGTPTFSAREGVKLDGTSQHFTTGLDGSTLTPGGQGIVGAYTRLTPGFPSNFSETLASIGSDHYLGVFKGPPTTVGGEFFGSGYFEFDVSGATRGANSISATSTDTHAISNQLSGSRGSAGAATLPSVELIYGVIFVGGIGYERSDNQFAAAWAGFGKGWTIAETQAFHADLETLLDVFGAGVVS